MEKKYFHKLRIMIKENKSIVMTIIVIAIIGDIFFIVGKSDIRTFGILGLSIFGIIVYGLSSRLVFKVCLSFLGMMFISFLFLGTSMLTEKIAVWWFLFFVVGVLKQWREIKVNDLDKNITSGNIVMALIKRVSSFVYSLLGPILSFKLAMSPLGKMLFRFVLGKGKEGRQIVFTTKYNFLMNLDTYEYLMSGYFFMGETNPYETKMLRKKLKPEDTFIDVGTHIGWYSLNAAQVVGIKGKVVAFEPNPACIDVMEKNVKLNKLSNLVLEKIALSDKEGEFDFWIGDDMGGSFIKENTQRLTVDRKIKKVKVKAMTLDAYCKKHQVKNITLMKIDVEGAEMQVLKGAKNTLKKFEPDLIMEVVDDTLGKNQSSKNELLKFLSNLGYQSYAFTAAGLIPYQSGDLQRTCNLYFTKVINE
jgi:FkbM family methyltransferase